MVTVQQAESIIFKHGFNVGHTTVALSDAIGRVLSECITADRDFPPFNRVAMDGIAIDFHQWEKGQREFQVVDIQAAGEPSKKLTDLSGCIEVMNGAVLPEGTDTVIRYEDVKIEKSKATITVKSVMRGQHIHKRSQDAAEGSTIIQKGTQISPAEIALLATTGYTKVSVLKHPATAIVASGDELVPVDATPLPHQIRRSNTYAIEAAMKQLGWAGSQFHFADDKEILLRELGRVLREHDVTILSGGVSKGKFDYIPEVLQACGIQTVFHQVSQRPGKPFWFGVSTEGKVVFALPGNPVSTFMCFYRYIKPWFLKSLGLEPVLKQAVLAQDFTFEPKLTYFLQVKTMMEAGKLMAYPQAGGGSGDFANLKDVDGFLELPLEKTVFKAGEVYPFIPFR